MNDDPKEAKKALEKELSNYKKLDRINETAEFELFFDLQIDTVVQKMLACFTGTGPKDWDDFCRLRGEVVGILYPIQQIRGAKVITKQIKEQLDSYYNTQP